MRKTDLVFVPRLFQHLSIVRQRWDVLNAGLVDSVHVGRRSYPEPLMIISRRSSFADDHCSDGQTLARLSH